jgi:hypothetical protein
MVGLSASGIQTTVYRSVLLFIICQSPITVAGVTVREFGSLYVAIALAAQSTLGYPGTT